MVDLIALVVVFFVGAIVGSRSPASVEAAINRLKVLEAKAKATVEKIAEHKAS